MASYYVYSGAAGAADGSTWADAFTTLAAAFSGKAAGDVFYVADDHAETQASAMTLTSPGTAAAPCLVLCARRSGGSVPPVSADLRTTATITTTGAFTLTISGAANPTYWEGVIFSGGSGAVNNGITVTSTGRNVFKNCSLRKPGTTAISSAINFNGGNADLINTTFHFGATGDAINIAGLFIWRNTASALGGTIPTTGLINPVSGAIAVIEGVDLSAAGSSSTLVRATSSRLLLVLKDCKLGASVNFAANPTLPLSNIDLIRCDSGDTNYRQERSAYQGDLTTETTIVRTGGASDGTTPISWKVVTTANPEWGWPFECFPISIWNETVGSSVTVTVECRGAAVPNNDEVWMDVEYLGTSGFPQGNFATTTKADILATGAACTSSSESWGGSTSSFKLEATITPQEKGPITVYVKVAKVSSTFYIDPKITLS